MAGDKITIDVEVKGAKQSAEYISNLNKRFEEAAEGAEKLSEKLTQVSEDSQQLLAKGMSESLPEQLNDIAKGFSIASDKSLTLSTRLQAGVGAMLIAKNAIGDLGGRIIEYGRALDEANVRSEAQARRLRELGTATREIQQLNNGAVQSTDAYALRVSLLGDGIHATAQEQAQLIELARRNKLAGEDNAAAIQRVTAAINGDAAAQRLLGMSTEEGLTAQERFRNAIRLSANEHARLGQVQMSADEIAARNAATHQRGSDALLQMVAAGTGLSSVYDTLTRSADGWRRAGQDLYRWVAENTEGHRTLGTATRNLSQETNNLGVSVETTKARMEAMNQHLIQQRDLANQAALAQKELASSLLEVNLAARSGETSGDTVNRNLRALNRQLVRGDQERRTRREVYRQAVRNGANARAVRQALGMDEPEDGTLVAMERSRNTESVDDLVSQLRSAGLMPNLQMARGVRGRRSNSTQLQLVMLLLQRQLQSEQRLRGIMQGGPGEMGLDGFREGGSERGTFETELGALSERGLYSGEIERQRTNMRAAIAARDYDENKRREMIERDRRESLGGRVASGLGLKDTLEENLASPIQSAASSVNNAFSSMTQGLNGFLDTLIESPEEVGTASVAIAKNFLKGLSMMALQESLFNLAKGVAASFTPGMQASAAGYFTASAIFAGVAAATGAGAAGIAAQQRGAQQVPAAANGGGGSGPARVDGGRGSDREERGSVVFNINSTVFDPERAEETVARLMAGANRRGL
jgi:hypothetical protein